MTDADGLLCPSCGQEHPPNERFCKTCGMPLVHRGGAQALSERQQKARKIKPQYSEGAVKIARAENQIEAEFIAAMLLEEGIPSVLSARSARRGIRAGDRHARHFGPRVRSRGGR